MPETHYIEIDEEIISTVGRLRKSSAAENIFVFPKRSLILQSIINLKLLAREAEKLGKTVIVMTQDEQGARLAEKAGLRIQEYQDSVLRAQRQQDTAARFTVRHGETIPMPVEHEPQTGLRRSNEIGSANFHAEATATSPVPPGGMKPAREPNLSEPAPRTLRVRNTTPPMQTALNSMRSEPAPTGALPPMQNHPVSTPTAGRATAGRELPSTERKERLRRLFENREEEQRSKVSRPVTALSSSSTVSPVPERHTWRWFVAGTVLLIGGAAASYIFLRPEAIIAIEPQSVRHVVKRSLVGTVDGTAGIPVRSIESEKTVRISRAATGQDAANNAKASGVITIMNAYSEAAQPLVATTRFELPDGRLYRLAESITVPGTRTDSGKTVPGKIDARVVADSTGDRYNITSGTFTIPGFKGSPKFEKITAEVKGAFSGGGSDGQKSSPSISVSDLDLAKSAAADEAKRAAAGEIGSSLKPGEVILVPSLQANLIGTPIAPIAGTVAEDFEYEARFQVKGFVISEAAIRSLLDKETTESGGVILKSRSYDISYGAVLANFESKRIDLTVESDMLFQASIDPAALKSGLLGLDEEGIRTYLSTHPEIRRLQVEFKPDMFIATIPDDAERVTVDIIESE